MQPDIPYTSWQPLSVAEVVHLFTGAPFAWALAGGYAVERFLGRPLREHGDIDIVIFRDEQLRTQTWLAHAGWQLFAADPPGTLRVWTAGEFLPVGIHDIWGHRQQANAWELQLMIIEVDGTDWVFRRNARVRGSRDALLTTYNGIPCLRIEVQLLYKAHGQRPKDVQDLEACVPRLSADAKHWLQAQVRLVYPAGHAWLDVLS